MSNILSIWPNKIKDYDYGDAVLAAAALELKVLALPFDKPFSRQLSNLNIPHKLI